MVHNFESVICYCFLQLIAAFNVIFAVVVRNASHKLTRSTDHLTACDVQIKIYTIARNIVMLSVRFSWGCRACRECLLHPACHALTWLVGRRSAAACSAARLSVCRVVLQIPLARHARLVADKTLASSSGTDLRGRHGGPGPRPPTKPFIFLSFVICVCLAFFYL